MITVLFLFMPCQFHTIIIYTSDYTYTIYSQNNVNISIHPFYLNILNTNILCKNTTFFCRIFTKMCYKITLKSRLYTINIEAGRYLITMDMVLRFQCSHRFIYQLKLCHSSSTINRIIHQKSFPRVFGIYIAIFC
ncbi:hypothetical protein MTBBW1_900029 [Desulfamplus magnetovallimortis]|uniref:Uncharacterized protein n=1 Tax=Desulfamplus magnetovallimortis TaxID=1246637 RepID=A0A1W1HLB8_9BACT|nr:hypothetical protein MTBBW1_900029 [Desulfamplus magnetovallimortis]